MDGVTFPENTFPETLCATCPVGGVSHGETSQLCWGLMEIQAEFWVRPILWLERQILGLHKKTPGHLCPEIETWKDQSLFRMQSAHSQLCIAMGDIGPGDLLQARQALGVQASQHCFICRERMNFLGSNPIWYTEQTALCILSQPILTEQWALSHCYAHFDRWENCHSRTENNCPKTYTK